MNLKFISIRALAELRSQIDVNRPAYLAGQAGTVLKSLNPATAVLESRISADPPPNLEMPSDSGLHDAENVRRVFQWLHHLTPVQASDPRLWVYLTHGPYADYTVARWPIDADTNVADRIRDRYFLEGEGLASLVRNSVARLWWFGYLTRDSKQADPFELADVLLSLQDIQVAFLERAIGRSPRILHGALRLWKKMISERGNIPQQGSVVQKWAKLIRLHGGVVLLDALPEQQLQNVIWLKLGDALDEKFPDLEEVA
ncbi:MAG: DUF6339 family protein [Verrucomicrobiota bacterium]|jgi:hypothetical protein